MQKSLILEKAIKFALRIVKLYQYLIEVKKEFVLGKELLYSGTMIGKFIKSANQAESKQNFTFDMQNALKKASDSEYWLLILYHGGFLEENEYNSINDDCIELLKMLTAIVKTSKKNV